VKPTTTTTVKPTVKATPKVTKKPVVTKKAPVRKRKVVTLIPTPKPVWPPKGFRANGEIYAKVPTASELLGILSADKNLTLQQKVCKKYACGVVRLASSHGCTWWEIAATVSGPTSATEPTISIHGVLRTTAKSTSPKEIITVYLISTELLGPGIGVGGLSISCYHSPATEKIPTNLYTPSVTATPTPTGSPSTEPTSTASATPSGTPTN
jgi:hypothetical protein